MDFRIFLFLFLILLCAIDDIHARKSGGSSRSSGRSSSHSYGGYRSKSSGSSSTSHHTSNSHNYGSNSNTHGTSLGTHTSVPHGQTSSTSHGTSTGSRTQHQQNKDITTSFLNAEGGGATRPVQPSTSSTHFGGMHPSAPPAPSLGTPHMSNTGGFYGTQTPGQYGKPNVVTDSKQTSSPYVPSAPSLDYAPKTSSIPLQNQAPNTFGSPSPPWSNPHFNANPQPSTGSQQPHIGFTDYSKTPSHVPHGMTPSYTPNPPYPINPRHPTPHVSHSSYPNHRGYSHGSNTSSSHLNQQPFGGHGSYPQPIPPTMPGQMPPYSHSYGQSSQMPMWNPYSTHPASSPYAAPGPAYYPQQQHYLAQPAAQPFVPGQTVIMVPGQQDSGRGLGQIFKEALVFSTVNAGVNRLLNPPHHYVSESRPDSGTTSTTTHITYNNQYFNTAPGSNGTMDPTSVPQGGVPGGSFTNYQSGGFVPPNMPTGGMSPSPGNTNFANPQPGNTNFPYTPSTNSMGTANNNAGSIPSNGAGVVGGIAPGNAAGGVTSSNVPQSNAPNKPESQSNSGSVNPLLGSQISDNELYQITEELFAKDTFNVMKYITLNIQNRTSSPNITDEAKEPLFTVQPEIFDHPTIYVTRALYDNYEHDSRKKENRTLEKRHEENLLIDTYLNTNVMATAMKWLSDHSFIDPDDFEKQDVLRHMWFNNFDGTASGFERVFTSEKYADLGILGVQDWNYFEYLETQKRINYMGYVDKLNLGDRASLLKLNFQMEEVIRPNATIFIGTLPELQMSLYTICFYARPNNFCPVSLGGTKFNIFTHSFRHFGYDLIDLALPVF